MKKLTVISSCLVWMMALVAGGESGTGDAKEGANTMSTEPQSGTIEYHSDFPTEHIPPRPVEVWLPAGYDPTAEERYPVLYMHDGQFLLRHGQTPFTVKDWLWDVDLCMARLIEEGEIRPAIVVAVWANLESKPNRKLEFMPQKPLTDAVWEMWAAKEPDIIGGKVVSDNYLKFLVDELKPFIDETYRTLSDRENTFVMGSSMGGMISAYAISEYPDVFGGAACLSTHWPIGDGVVLDWYTDQWPEAGNLRVYFDYGTETIDAEYEPYQLKMDALMRSKGFQEDEDWMTRRFDGADHSPKAWRERLHIPLKFLLGDR
jgi:enterochelin esterase-like enzyme